MRAGGGSRAHLGAVVEGRSALLQNLLPLALAQLPHQLDERVGLVLIPATVAPTLAAPRAVLIGRLSHAAIRQRLPIWAQHARHIWSRSHLHQQRAQGLEQTMLDERGAKDSKD